MPYGLSGWEGRGEDGREEVEMELFMGCGELQIWRLDGGEKQTDMGGLGCHLASSDVQSKLQPRAMSGSMTLDPAAGVCVDFHGYVTTEDHKEACSWSGLSPEAMLMHEGHGVSVAILI